MSAKQKLTNCASEDPMSGSWKCSSAVRPSPARYVSTGLYEITLVGAVRSSTKFASPRSRIVDKRTADMPITIVSTQRLPTVCRL
jgi:hypothetical protein